MFNGDVHWTFTERCLWTLHFKVPIPTFSERSLNVGSEHLISGFWSKRSLNVHWTFNSTIFLNFSIKPFWTTFWSLGPLSLSSLTFWFCNFQHHKRNSFVLFKNWNILKMQFNIMIQEDDEEVLVCHLVYTLLKYFQAFLPTHSFCANHVHLVSILYLSFCTTHPIGR